MPRGVTEKLAINRMLGTHGLPPLESGRGLCVALGYLVRDHEHLRSLLARCEPEHRVDMYEGLKAGLRFEPKPLDVYISESAMKAEREQLPTIDEEGNYHWHHIGPNLSSADKLVAQAAVDEALSKQKLWLVCSKCTRDAVFTGATRYDAVHNARVAGWALWEHEGQQREICPDCPGPADRGAVIDRAEFELVTLFKLCPKDVIARYLSPSPAWTKTDWDHHALEAAKQWDKDGRPGAPVAN
jgi:hypothetical protein